MNLIDYWIQKIQDVDEFQKLASTEQVEIDLVNAAVDEFPKEIVVDTATNEGLSRYESMLGLEASTDYDLRRFNILSKLNNKLPYTMNWLKKKLNAVLGEDNYYVNLSSDAYWLTIGCPEEKQFALLSLTNDLRQQIPANIGLTIAATTNVEGAKNFVASAISSYEEETLNDTIYTMAQGNVTLGCAISDYTREVLANV